jgi:hypothetical protein
LKDANFPSLVESAKYALFQHPYLQERLPKFCGISALRALALLEGGGGHPPGMSGEGQSENCKGPKEKGKGRIENARRQNV